MIGCRLNQSELERIGADLRRQGHILVGQMAEADFAIINTCAVTAKAASDSRQLARRAQREGVQNVILTGCWATLEPEVAINLPGVSQVIPNRSKDHLAHVLSEIPQENFDLEPFTREPLPGVRHRMRAFIKVQDGCNKRCSFCITTIARGPSRSRSLKAILSDIQAAVKGGANEVILTGVHLGAWGRDLDQALTLSDLLQSILYHSDIHRLRLSSLEPWGITEDFLALYQEPRLCRHLHLPLQSGCAATLKRMARGTTPARFKALVNRIRQRYPTMAISTDIIVGFPGETGPEFNESLAFVREMNFADGHVFSFSARPGTEAARLPHPIPANLTKERNQEVRDVLTLSNTLYKSNFIGETVPVLWESLSGHHPTGWTLMGRTSENIRVLAEGHPSWLNLIQPVELEGYSTNGTLRGRVKTTLPSA